MLTAPASCLLWSCSISGTYDGALCHGKWHGHGILRCADGYEYTGNFSNGLAEGKGELTWAKLPDGYTHTFVGNSDKGKMTVGDFKRGSTAYNRTRQSSIVPWRS